MEIQKEQMKVVERMRRGVKDRRIKERENN
jgi:hypothetical protein